MPAKVGKVYMIRCPLCLRIKRFGAWQILTSQEEKAIGRFFETSKNRPDVYWEYCDVCQERRRVR